MTISMPEYLTEQDEDTIRQRLLDHLPNDLDKTPGGYVWDAIEPDAIELTLAATWAQEVLRRGFVSTSFGEYIDLRCAEHGIERRGATKSAGYVTFTGTAGTVITAGTQVNTTSTETSPAVFFETTENVTINSAGVAMAGIQAVEAGIAGNISAGAIVQLAMPVSGISGVANTTATYGGLDIETDESLLNRYLQRVRSPSTGGNKADYANWAMEVSGVGGVAVVPVRDGPGTVSISIINTTKVPAEAELVEEVQNYIAPPWVNEVEAEEMTLGGHGAILDTGQDDDTGGSMKMFYDSAGEGTITHKNLQFILQKPGIWQARIRAKVDDINGTADLLQIGLWDVSGHAWCKTSPSSIVDAVRVVRACDMETTFTEVMQDFFWNGQDEIELRITRLSSDTTTTVWIDRVIYYSAFSKDTGEVKAPIGVRVTVEPAMAVLINVSTNLVVAQGYNADSVKSAIEENIKAYIKSLAFAPDNDIRYVRIGQAILDTPGVTDYQNLTVNGGMSNVVVGDQEVAVLGMINL